MNLFGMNHVRSIACGALLAGAVIPATAHADLVGSSVTVSGKYLCSSTPPSGPTGCSLPLGDSPVTETIAAGGTTFPSAAASGTVTVNGDQLIWTATESVTYDGPNFNGFEFQISGAPSIVSVSVDAADNLGPATNNYASGFLLTGGDTVWMDFNSQHAISGEKLILDLAFAPTTVPEPPSLLLFGSGVVGLMWLRPRRK